MTEWVNFQEVRAKVSLSDVLFAYYRLNNLTKEGDKVFGPCPVHNGDSSRAFHADLGHGKSGSAYSRLKIRDAY